jgi:hypothetical protein
LDFARVIFYRERSSALCPTPNLEDQITAFMFHSNRVAQLYPQAAGSLLVAFYVSQGYDGGILTRLQMGLVEIITADNEGYFAAKTSPGCKSCIFTTHCTLALPRNGSQSVFLFP